MTADAEFLKSRLIWRFRRSGKDGKYTKPFDDFPESLQSEIVSVVSLQSGELPVILYYRNSNQWVLLTTRRMIKREADDNLDVAYASMRDANFTGRPLLAGASGTSRLNSLSVDLDSGDSVELELEPGLAFSGFWNVLKAVIGDPDARGG